MCVSMMGPFYAPEATVVKGLSHTYAGLVIAASPLSSFFFSMIIGKMMSKWGRKKVMIISLIIFILLQIFFGLIGLINNKYLFLACSLIIRLI